MISSSFLRLACIVLSSRTPSCFLSCCSFLVSSACSFSSPPSLFFLLCPGAQDWNFSLFKDICEQASGSPTHPVCCLKSPRVVSDVLFDHTPPLLARLTVSRLPPSQHLSSAPGSLEPLLELPAPCFCSAPLLLPTACVLTGRVSGIVSLLRGV